MTTLEQSKPADEARNSVLRSGSVSSCNDLFGGYGRKANPKDVVITPDATAKMLIEYFKPTGRILDPCRGNGAFWKQMPGAEWCEIAQGKDFLNWSKPMDWIISNPPYSNFIEWLTHSFKIADDVVYLVPLHKIFHTAKTLDSILGFGGIKEILVLGPGTHYGFPLGFVVGAFHFKRGYTGNTRIGYPPNVR